MVGAQEDGPNGKGGNSLKIQQLVESGQVLRYHVEPIPNRQTNAQHSWGVAAIITMIHDDPSANLLKAAIFHDAGERVAGDMPAPFKWANPDIKGRLDDFEDSILLEYGVYKYVAALTEAEHKLLKLADYLEAASFGYTIYRQGVIYGLQIFNACYQRLLMLGIEGNVKATAILTELVDLIHDYNVEASMLPLRLKGAGLATHP